MPVALISHSDCGRHDTGWRHPEHVGRLTAIPRALREDPALFHALVHHEARHASTAELALAHEAGYIARVAAIAEGGGGALDADTIVSEGSYLAATAATGAVLDGVDFALTGSARCGRRDITRSGPVGWDSVCSAPWGWRRVMRVRGTTSGAY